MPLSPCIQEWWAPLLVQLSANKRLMAMKFPHCGENWNPRCCCGWLENKQSSAAIANARLWNLQHWAKIPVFLLPLGPKIFPPVKRQTQATKTPKQFSEAQGCFGWTRVVRCGIFCCCRSDQSDRHLCSFRVSLLVVLPLTRLLVGLLWLEQQPQNELWRPHCLPLHCLKIFGSPHCMEKHRAVDMSAKTLPAGSGKHCVDTNLHELDKKNHTVSSRKHQAGHSSVSRSFVRDVRLPASKPTALLFCGSTAELLFPKGPTQAKFASCLWSWTTCCVFRCKGPHFICF